jgi:hypothetical protein
MPGIVDVPGVEVFGKGKGFYDLPCGYVDSDGKVHRTVILREMTGAEEDMMDDDDLPVNERTTSVLTACCEKIGAVEDKAVIRQAIADDLKTGLPLTSSDRIAMLIYLRRVSCGDVYNFERRCPRCGYVNKNKSLDLRKLKIGRVPDDRVAKRRVKVKLPRSGREAIVRVLTASQEHKITGLRLNQKDLRSAAVLARLESVSEEIDELDAGGKPTGKKKMVQKRVDVSDGMSIVKALPSADRDHLRKVYDVMEAEIDTKVEVECSGRLCNAEFSFPLDLGQSFFSNLGAKDVSAEELNWL